MTNISIDLTDEQAKQLQRIAAQGSIPVEALAKAAIEDFVRRQSADFENAADHVLKKNQELYRRLS